MTPADLLVIVDNALDLLKDLTTGKIVKTDPARVLIMAIAGQESDWAARRQIGCFTPGQFQTVGARGFWQFERMGAVAQLIGEVPTLLEPVCQYLIIPFNTDDIYEALAWNDTLAAIMARLLLWVDPAPLPAVGDVQEGWNYYKRNWGPGAPRPEIWPSRYATAQGLLH